jgi:hypothetical protein
MFLVVDAGLIEAAGFVIAVVIGKKTLPKLGL